MSLTQDLQPVQLLSSKYDWIKEAKIGTRIGNESRSRMKYSSINQTSVTGAQSQTWQITNESLFESAPFMEVEYDFSVTGFNASDAQVNLTVAGVEASFNNNFGLSSFPYNRCIQNISVQMNNSAIMTTNTNDIVDSFLYGENPEFLAMLSPASKLDNYYKFDSASLANTLRNGGDTIDAIDSRGIGGNYEISFSSDTAGTVSVSIKMQEAIIARPFQYHSKETRNPFFNVNDLKMIINYDNDLSKFIKISDTLLGSASYGGTGANAVARVQLSGFKITPKLVIDSFTPQIQIEKPLRCYWNTPLTNVFKAPEVTLTTGQSTQVRFNNYVINGIPKLFVLYVKAIGVPIPAGATAPPINLNQRGEAFAQITGVEFSFSNKVNQFTDLNTQQDLYQMSIKNGYNQRFGVFNASNVQQILTPATSGTSAQPATFTPNTGCGSIFYFRPEDLNMNSGDQSNVNGSFNIEIKVNCTNKHSETLTYQACFASIYDNILMWDGSTGRFSDFKPLLAPSEAVSAPMELMNDTRIMNSILGGSFWSDAWKTIKKVAVAPLTKEIVNLSRNNIPGIKNYLRDGTAVGDFLKKKGYSKHGPYDEEEHGGNSRSRTMYGRTQTHSNKGGNMMTIGGKRLSKKELLDML